MRRREFITALLLAVTIRSAQAQKPAKVYRVALVHPNRPATDMTEASHLPGYRTFFQELRRLGYVEGQNLVVERYSGEGRPENYPKLARDVIRREPDLIVTMGGLSSSFKPETATIPITGFTNGDPVLAGLVSSLARPGGNITGVNIAAGYEIWGKRFELLRELVPSISKVGFLSLRANAATKYAAAAREAPNRVGIPVVGPTLDSPVDEAEYRRVFAAMSQEGADAVIVGEEGENNTNFRLIVELAAQARLPAIYAAPEYAEAGGLMAYAVDFNELFRVLAAQTDQILKGTKPGEIPYYLPTKFQLIINLKTAKALGIHVPEGLSARADKVIE